MDPHSPDVHEAALISSLLAAARSGDARATGRLLTLVEQGGPAEHDVIRAVFAGTGRVHVTGVTGAPGAGKSTLVDRLVTARRAAGDRVAVVAIDPSSPFTGGAILGDRVRMQDHATDDGVFVRSMATRGQLGGLARATAGVVRVLDSAGWPFVIVETVGAGQVEVDVAETADTTVVVVNPGWGDSVQAAKAGLLEVADVLVVTKADRPGADQAVRDLEHTLDLADPPPPWRPPVLQTVATTGQGIDEVVAALGRHRAFLAADGRGEQRQARRLEAEVRRLVAEEGARLYAERCHGPDFHRLMADVAGRRLDPLSAAAQLAGGGSPPSARPHRRQ